MNLATTRGIGQYRTSRVHRSGWERRYRSGTKKGVLACPGWNGDADHFFTVGTDQRTLIEPIIEAGFPFAAREEGSQWGNTESRARFTDLRTYAQSTLGFASGKVHLFGLSAGSLAALRWAMANPSLVQSIAVVLPAVDPQDIYDRDPASAGITASMNTAYSGRPVDAENPSKNTASFSGIPIKMWYSENDPICLPAKVTAFASATGASTVSLGTQSGGAITGHSINGIDPSQIANWIKAND